jgi:hypothetical protein
MKPILFSGPMVRAILEGRKTQTRRARKAVGPCPHGQPGDLLWVRETWAVRKLQTGYWVEWKADGSNARIPEEVDAFALFTIDTWRPSIFMPRWASRLTLRLTEVRTETLHRITEADAHAEGVADVAAYAALWDALNAKRGYGWNDNPFVWVLSFEVVP